MGPQLPERIIVFGNRFKNRLEPWLVDAALQYIDFNEVELAFETICDHLADHYISITRDEYDEMMSIATDMGYGLGSERNFTSLEGLVE